MIFKNLMVSKLLKSKISNNRVAPYLKHTPIPLVGSIIKIKNKSYRHFLEERPCGFSNINSHLRKKYNWSSP